MRKAFARSLHRVAQALAPGDSGWVSLDAAQPLNSVGGHASHAGQTVNSDKAMQLSAVWDCVRKTAETVSALPLAQYEKGAQGTRTRVDDDLSEILTESPSRGVTAVEFWEAMVAHMVLRGNGVAERLLVGRRLVGLRALPGCVPTLKRDGSIEYSYVDRGKKVTLPDDKVFHLRGFGAGDGLGLSAIRYGANSMGLSLAADESAGRIFANAAMPSGMVQANQSLTDVQRKQLQDSLDEYRGSKNAGKIMALEAGLTWVQLQMNPEDAQLLETRRFQIEDICRWFGIPPIVIGHASDGQTMWGSGVEQILLSWLSLGINPILRRIEARVRTDLIEKRRARRYIEFKREAMLQMDSKAKGDFMLKMRLGGFMSGDEGRDLLNLPRRGGANDDLFIQTSMEPTELIGKEQRT